MDSFVKIDFWLDKVTGIHSWLSTLPVKSSNRTVSISYSNSQYPLPHCLVCPFKLSHGGHNYQRVDRDAIKNITVMCEDLDFKIPGINWDPITTLSGSQIGLVLINIYGHVECSYYSRPLWPR